MSGCHTEASSLRTTKIKSVRTASPTVKVFSLKDKACARARSGQFLMLWVPGVDEIPFSVLAVEKNGLVSVAVKDVGEATHALHMKKAGDLIGVRGPFGNNFTEKGRRLLMVGGGTGVAPLLFLARKMIRRRARITFVLGAKTKSELLFMRELRGLRGQGVELGVSTEDGSCGVTGLCTEPLARIMNEEKFDVVYACGPEQMILKVYDLAREHGVWFEASLERLMRCAIGLCGSCVIGKYRVCKDGPVFTGRQLRQVRDEFGSSKRDRYGRKVPLD